VQQMQQIPQNGSHSMQGPPHRNSSSSRMTTVLCTKHQLHGHRGPSRRCHNPTAQTCCCKRWRAASTLHCCCNALLAGVLDAILHLVPTTISKR